MIKMRNIIVIAIIGLLFSCSSSDRNLDSSTTFKDDFKRLDTIVSFSGCWLNEDYFNNIRQFKSPKNAQDGSLFIFIPHRTLQQTIMTYNFHEGGSFLKTLKRGNDYEIWEVQDDSLTQQLYTVDVVSSTKIKLDNSAFIKINPQKSEHTYHVLEEILFKGKYTNADEKTIEFKPNGQVVGLVDFKFYRPAIDYYDAGMQVDQVGLGSSQKDLEWFGFKFKQDTLELYKLNCLIFDSTYNRCVEVDYGQLTYKLWREE